MYDCRNEDLHTGRHADTWRRKHVCGRFAAMKSQGTLAVGGPVTEGLGVTNHAAMRVYVYTLFGSVRCGGIRTRKL